MTGGVDAEDSRLFEIAKGRVPITHFVGTRR
jgi:hypothetical protein